MKKKMRKASRVDVFRAAFRAADREIPESVIPIPRDMMGASAWMAMLDAQATRLRHAVRQKIPWSARAEARSMVLLLAVLDGCFRRKAK